MRKPTTRCFFLPWFNFSTDVYNWDVSHSGGLRQSASFVKGEVTPGAWLPLPGFKKDACSRSGLQCPLEAGKQYTFSKTIRVLPAFPTVSLYEGRRAAPKHAYRIIVFCRVPRKFSGDVRTARGDKPKNARVGM
ncbi:hypothetical protein HPB48_008001 [Haemaphysalis longicornis]|uniref:MD-2-related lipid-recognition domain-containing protein n=1 Tax=Haemaphysalis longicornis TaxID=44386 RepID=A0A9J6GXJ0_HAELO|nr:hypothetical protein HPB48_008001 [Haemaphysalis longicornis]